jgi:ribonuclease HI
MNFHTHTHDTTTAHILQWNCNGIINKTAELSQYLTDTKNKPDIICLQETFLKPHQIYNLKGYNIIRKDRTITRKGGLATLVKTGINYTLVDQNQTGIESLSLQIKLNNKEVTVINIYQPPETPYEVTSLTTLLDQPNIIAVGDFNAHSPLWGDKKLCKMGEVLEGILHDCDLTVLNTGQGTYQKHQGGLSAIDIAVASKNLSLQTNWEVHANNSMGSDHFPISITIGNQIHSEDNTQQKYNLKRADWDSYKANCRSLFGSSCRDENLKNFYSNITAAIISAANASIPKSKNTPKHKPVPYWNDHCYLAVKNRNKAQKLANNTLQQKDIIEYKRAKAKAQYTIKASQKQYWNEYCDTLNSDTKLSSVWRNSKRMAGNNSQARSLPTLIHNNTKYTTSLEKANILAQSIAHTSSSENYGENFKKHLQETVEVQPQADFFRNLKEVHFKEGLNEPFALHELKSAIRQCRKGSAPGTDQISYDMLKNLPGSSQKILLEFYNNLYCNESVMEEWKQSIVLPSLKKSKPSQDPLSYRPIALTSVMCKLMERLIANRLAWFMEYNNLFNSAQSGFRKRRSTIDHLVRLSDHINKTISNGQYTVATFIDFSNAFDMLWKEGLLKKLNQLGIQGNMYKFINAFLTDRSIRVQVGSTLSDIFKIENGTPQGSVISPLLFLIMINDIPTDEDPETGSSLFADDSAVWRSGPNIKFLIKRVQNLLERITVWCDLWGFKINTSKTVAMLFSKGNTSSKQQSELHLKIQGENIQFVHSTKFLGMVFDSKLNWLQHAKYVANKSKTKINLLRSLTGYSWGANKRTLLRIYRTLIRSTIEYGSEILHTAGQSSLNILNQIHSKCLGIICGSLKSTAIEAKENECGELPLKLNILRKQLRYAVKISVSTNNKSIEILTDSWKNYYGNRPIEKRSFHTIVHTTLENIGKIEGERLFSLPPWQRPTVSINTSLSTIINKQDTNIIIKQYTLQTLEEYNNHIHIYTDGSKSSDHSTGAAYFIPSLQIGTKISLSSHCTVFTAELLAIKKALDYINNNKHSFTSPVAIMSDSLSSLIAIKNFYSNTNPNIVLNITLLLHRITTHITPITLVWVPAHVGIRGNEVADHLAKSAAADADTANTTLHTQPSTSHTTDSLLNSLKINSTSIKVNKTIHNAFREIDAHITQLWQSQYTSSQKGSFYKRLVPKVSTKIKYYSKSRYKDKTISRLRFGRPALNFYLSKYGKRESPLCPHCSKDETVEHFIMQCTQYEILSYIQTHIGNTNCTLVDILTQDTLIECLSEKLKLINRLI